MLRSVILGLSILAAASDVKVELRPLKKVTTLAMGRCDANVTFRLTVSDGGSEDYYCPTVVWEWEDGTRSIEQSDCAPFREAAPADHSRTWRRTRPYQRPGSYRIRVHLCQAQRRIRTADAVAVVNGWEGYQPHKREEAGCSPARAEALRSADDEPISPPPSVADPCGGASSP